MQYEHLVSSQTIRDLRNLDFTGTDPLCSWDDRNKGLTMFAICPSTNAAHGRSTRTQMQRYEETQFNHLPRDRAAHEALSLWATNTAGIPTNRHALS